MGNASDYREFFEKIKMAGKIEIKNSSFLDRIEMWKQEEYCLEDDHINFYIPLTFDIEEAFGLELNPDETDDYINLYVDWYPNNKSVEMFISYIPNDSEDFCLDVVLTDEQKEKLKSIVEKECKTEYGSYPWEIWENK